MSTNTMSACTAQRPTAAGRLVAEIVHIDRAFQRIAELQAIRRRAPRAVQELTASSSGDAVILRYRVG